MKKIVIFFTIFIFITSLFANLDKVIYQTKVSKLNALSIKYYNEWKQKHDEAMIKAKLRDIPVIIDNEDVYMELAYFDEFDHPIYHIIENSNAAITISTDHVYSGGGAGLSLTGAGIEVREWDGGGVRSSHQEFTNTPNRITNGDATVGTHYHSTHVAGTIMASGFQANAKGMAYEATLKFFDWNSDTSEMATEAVAGMLLSNHSYGFGRGWGYDSGWVWYGQSSPGEDWNFGHYNINSQQFDAISYNAPSYLIIESAGNDRGDGPGSDPDHPDADGPYDCLADMAASKNVLTVAAVEDMTSPYSVPGDVVMSSFSSWGPCDDGRIKPDISANGTYLYSTYDTNDTAYNSISGTSMAAPSVTGSLALIQEHSDETDGVYLRSSTLKALTLHCADEAGSNDGPDYAFGWGLMNTERMANFISNDGIDVRILEETLSNGGTYQIVLPALGTDPFKATICWTDPEGTPVALSLDPSDPMLINDLDIRITKGGSTYYPWKLDRLNPANAATNSGDNSVDNVEQVYIASPTAENYTITITHKGTLVDDSGSTSSQQFGLIISGIESGYPLCDITNPSNGEVIESGTIETITVTASDPGGTITNVKIYIDNTLKVTHTSSPYEYVWDTGSETLDDHTIKAVALDNDLNETIKEITVSVANLPVNIFEDDFETNKGWTLSGEFERAAPDGLGGNYGNPDPASAYGGTNVLGVDLSGIGTYPGDYETSLADRAYQAVSPTIDCSDYNNVTLSFYRWLNVESPNYDHAYIDINNGSGWQQIWTNSSLIEDTAWSQQNFDISTYADGQATVQIRFCMGGSDTSWQYSGWNIDNLIISGESTAIPGQGQGNNLGDPTQPAQVDVAPIDIEGSSVNPDVIVDPTGDLGITVNVTVTDEVQGSTPVPNPNMVIISYAVDIIGTISGINLFVDLEFTGLSNLDQIHCLNGTNWLVPNGVSWATADHVTFNLDLVDRSASTEIILSRDNPLPVSLSSFTTTFSNGTPIINWVTQSESDNIGWNIYRAVSYNFGQAQILNLSTFPGNGTTSQPSFYSFTDEYDVYEGSTYWYWIESISGSGETEIFGPTTLTIPTEGNDIQEIPLATDLYQNFPNPFNPSTLISFDVKEYETGILSIYNIKGQLIITEEFETGRHQFPWDARNQASGVYLYQLKTNSYTKIMKMLLVK